MMVLGEFDVDKQRTHVNDAEMTLRNLLEFVQENKEFYHQIKDLDEEFQIQIDILLHQINALKWKSNSTKLLE